MGKKGNPVFYQGPADPPDKPLSLSLLGERWGWLYSARLREERDLGGRGFPFKLLARCRHLQSVGSLPCGTGEKNAPCSIGALSPPLFGNVVDGLWDICSSQALVGLTLTGT